MCPTEAGMQLPGTDLSPQHTVLRFYSANLGPVDIQTLPTHNLCTVHCTWQVHRMNYQYVQDV